MAEQFPKQGMEPATQKKVEVEAIVCPQCGGPIKGTGPCQNCGQLLIVFEGRNFLSISEEDLKGVQIIPPSEKVPEGEIHAKKWRQIMWNFKGAINTYASHYDLWAIGNGNPDYGSKIYALWAINNKNRNAAGGERPTVKEVRQFALDTALEQSIKRSMSS